MIIMRKDKRTELERKVDESLEEIRVKGFTKERNEEYQRRLNGGKSVIKRCMGESWVKLGNDG